MFRARLAAIFSTSHKMPRLPRNLHLATMRFARTRNKTRLKYCAYHAKWRWTRPKCCACHENCNASSENVAKSIVPATHSDFRRVNETRLNVTKCHACHMKRSNATCETSKSDPFYRTYHRHAHSDLARMVANGCERLRTVGNGCERLRTVALRRANTPSTPTPRVKREPLVRIRGRTSSAAHSIPPILVVPHLEAVATLDATSTHWWSPPRPLVGLSLHGASIGTKKYNA